MRALLLFLLLALAANAATLNVANGDDFALNVTLSPATIGGNTTYGLGDVMNACAEDPICSILMFDNGVVDINLFAARVAQLNMPLGDPPTVEGVFVATLQGMTVEEAALQLAVFNLTASALFDRGVPCSETATYDMYVSENSSVVAIFAITFVLYIVSLCAVFLRAGRR